MVDGPGDAEQAKDLALQVGELHVEDLDGFAGVHEAVALREAEQAKHLLGGRSPARAVLGVQGQLFEALALHRAA